MARKKRVLVLLEPEIDKAINELVAVTGHAKAPLLGELIEEAMPVILQMTEAFRLAKEQSPRPFAALQKMSAMAQGVSAELEKQIKEVEEQLKKDD